MLVNFNEMLKDAKEKKYAVPQFNINNLEWTKYILEKMQEENLPVILGVSEGAKKYMGGFYAVRCMVEGLIKDLNITIPVCLHLDHGSSFESCKEAIDAGFSSVMIDASKYDLETNKKITKEVVDYAHSKGVSVEAEVGHVGGTEDNVYGDVFRATIEDCVEISKTGIDALAPALGSVHGLYKGEPNLDFDRMKQIDETLSIPLVLHGGTGIPDDKIKHAIACGTCKINVNTECQLAFNKLLREFLADEKNEKIYDPRKILGPASKGIAQAVDEKMHVFGSVNKQN